MFSIAFFRENCKKYGIKNYYIHTPYYINLASASNRVYYGSVSTIVSELERADVLGARAVVTHLGSARELGEKGAQEKLIRGLKKVFQDYFFAAGKKAKGRNFKADLLLEITAGAGKIMGDNFEEIAYFIKETEKQTRNNILGVCFDTAHAFASGYDLRDKAAVRKTFDEFDRTIGMERLKLVHCNDSKSDFGSHVDRHDCIGNGKIGLNGLSAVVREPRLSKVDFIIETLSENAQEDIETLRNL